MLADPADIARALGLPPGSEPACEPLGDAPGAPERWSGGGRAVIVRRPVTAEAAQNHAAVFEALANAGFAAMPRLLGFSGIATIEEEVPGLTALQVEPPPGAAEAAVAALAALHALPLREGLDWEKGPAGVLPECPPPLYRLGFAAAEREAAAPHFAAAREALLAGPFGFAHRAATAANVLLAPGRAWLVNFAAAGFGPQLFDLAAFLLTSGLGAPARRALAGAYARLRELDPAAAADLADLAGLAWGTDELLWLPRRQVEALGDDAALAALNLAAVRIERGMREPAGDSPIAAAIRAALWG
ncbi:MAG: hypothetical protein KatS3mg064_1063 [Tepidiforma sp.]|nr:phosphotransferase [Tepidiforma sp.]GIW17906.1 MAG: hypothetical protein KatS3mg064_1063 [Tepidiforma sp.]